MSMRNIIIASVAVAALFTSAIAEPTFAKRGSEVIDETTYLGNSNNEADEGQGGQGATTETTIQEGPPGQIKQDRNDDDCHNCDVETTPRDKPGRDR
jgi:hypothetical protein